VGPKSETMMELSGAPTIHEVESAICRLRECAAPGSNRLPPEIFKAGGAILVHCLQQDFAAIWPARPGLA